MLTFILLIPILTGIYLMVTRGNEHTPSYSVALAGAVLTGVMALGMLFGFDASNPEMQYVENYVWVSSLHIHFALGVDGISLWMVVLTAFLTIIALGTAKGHRDGPHEFFALLLFLEAGTIGVFTALDTVVFYVFWELMLIPTYFLIGFWGEGKKVYATIKFVLFTLVGSLLMLVAIISLTVIHYEATGDVTFDIRTLLHTHISVDSQWWMFSCFFLAFAIKMPIFPLHSWLPHTYRACPIPALILLSGAMSKTGAYGMIRFVLPLFPETVASWGQVIGGLAAVGIVYGAWIAIAQRDLKSLVAYSSISHLGFIALGIFAMNGQGIEGSVLQMVNHGIIASALFVIVGLLETKLGTRNLDKIRGLKKAMPILYGMFMLIALAALGLPGLNGFVGEFLILLGVWTSPTMEGLAACYVLMGGLAIVFASMYMLYMFQGTMQEKPENLPDSLTDINSTQIRLLLPACLLVVFIGLFPGAFVDRVSPSVEHLLHLEKTVNLPSGDEGHGHH